MKYRIGCVLVGWLSLALSLAAQTSSSSSATSQVPPLMQFSNVATDVNGKPLTGVVGITFYLYKEQQGGSPLWMETQNVQPDNTGHYTVLLGSTTSQGLPTSIFSSGEAHWLSVQVQGQEEQPRVLLVSAPYALKAGDAETVGGLPPSAFVLAAPASATSAIPGIAATSRAVVEGNHASRRPSTCDVTSDGTAGVNALAKFTTACNVEASAISESGGNVGIGVAPVTTTKLYVSDTQSNFGTAWTQRNVFTSAATKNGTNYALAFDLDATDMTIPAGVTDNGYRLAIRGLAYSGGVNFAGTLANQFGVLAEAGIYQGKSGAKVVNAYGGDFTIFNNTPGTTISNAYGVYISNSGTGGTITNRYDLYASSSNAKNYFAGKVGIGTASPSATLDVNGTVNAATSFNLGGKLFASGSYANKNAFLGFSGNLMTTGTFNTATGYQALQSNTTGSYNTATGYQALVSSTTGYENTANGYDALSSNTGNPGNDNTANGAYALQSNTTGYDNTANGAYALQSNTTGNYNTALGDLADVGSGNLTNATAIGFAAVVDESNALVLGGTGGYAVNVGIGTTTPDNNLTVNGTADKPGGGSWGTYSDGRLKSLNGSFRSGLSQVLQIHPVRYRYKPDNALGIHDEDEHIGVVAQDVQKVIPEAVTENSKGYLLVNNDPIIWTMLNAIKEQQREIKQQQSLLRAQASALRRLEAQVREDRETLRKVKVQVAVAQPTLVAAK